MRFYLNRKKANLFVACLLLAFLDFPAWCDEIRFPTFAGWILQSFVSGQDPQNNLDPHLMGAYKHYEGQNFLPAVYVRPVDEAQLQVQVFEFPDRLQAFGFYSSLRTPLKKFVQVGTEGFLGNAHLIFWKERRCVLMKFPGDYEDKKGILLALGSRIAREIPGDLEEPDLVAIFPEEGLLSHSARYQPKNLMGFQGMPGGFVAVYQNQNKKRAVFLAECADPEKAKETFRGVQEFFSRRGMVVENGPFKKENFFAGRLPERQWYLLRHGIYLVGFFPAPPAQEVETGAREIQKRLNRRQMNSLP